MGNQAHLYPPQFTLLNPSICHRRAEHTAITALEEELPHDSMRTDPFLQPPWQELHPWGARVTSLILAPTKDASMHHPSGCSPMAPKPLTRYQPLVIVQQEQVRASTIIPL
ncbi:uncharacterized protein LAESUDRAFT_754359 [Laetiporus sulphureus 93-53]|uniref:Uncharacterized protein n=1 Tax=Laetiporus sulphureus 93-53 TaxID=1314785 RepID=A0A165HJH4_9APHY|nr:uncharacterized protein LAESUDRAFT_754359 [Laetiporus sulphureus 93-53]KZT11806.1 hypothetical protein LAESUDRAFT_754359 [Laetiporus sulphureus 93-53]